MEGHIKEGYNKQRAQERTTWSSRHRSTDLVTLFWMSYSVLPLWEHLGLTNVLTSFPGDSVVKNTPAHAGDARDMGLILESGRSSGGGNGNPCQYSCQDNPMARGAWWAQSMESQRAGCDLEVEYPGMHACKLLAVPCGTSVP